MLDLVFYRSRDKRSVVEKMQEPDLNKMWITYIKIEGRDILLEKNCQDTTREKLSSILKLQVKDDINWFYFLLKPKPGDNPSTPYFRVVFTTTNDKPDDILPKFCTKPQRLPPDFSIAGIDEKLLIDEDIKKAWKLLG
jgi:hypothetical protein